MLNVILENNDEGQKARWPVASGCFAHGQYFHEQAVAIALIGK